jgi:hypothetical protein
MRHGEPNDEQTQLANDTVNMGSGNKEKRKRECNSLGTISTAPSTDTQDTTSNTRKTKGAYIHETKGKREEGRACSWLAE